MKIFIAFLLLLISPIELRRHNDDMYELDDLLKTQYNYRHRPYKQNFYDQSDDERYDPSLFQHEKLSSSRKKVLDENDDIVNEESESNDGTDRLKLTTTIINQNDLSDQSLCINKYDIKYEQLIKVKELKNGAHMIRYILIDKRSLSSNMNIHDSCMFNCCEETTCDLAMLSEQPTHDGYKCYLFACNGSCTLASHQDYTIMIPKKNLAYYTKSLTTIIDEKLTSTISNVTILQNKSYFREIAVIIFLVLGLLCTIILFVILCCYCRKVRKGGRRLKNYAVDADYLINGLYL
ncbi:unnamed protein product [Rotaria sordida]|uniref:Seven cysteines N-terminal domain-containing protein n=1 Tax=Rotaria sordida TaxID=392033 RepID=A0A813VVF8_9BILA|nr:unnamed protein product [Rotaria sordida]CAF1164732.1 unnamed protein product [Rotaria sordida]CAF1219688.1 unnamed protein product [Rotaria sordida]CAF3632255.1 unnamed protein product [Rotaria sordida]